MTWRWIGILVLATAGLTGCLEREEELVIGRDGSLRMLVTIRGDESDFEGPDALPAREAGWRVERSTREKADGETEGVLTAQQKFGRDEWPETFAIDPDGDSFLRFPTNVTIERRRDGVYYHFERYYEPRVQAPFKRHQEMLRKLWEEKIGEIEFAEAPADKQREAVTLLRDHELARQLEYVEHGLTAMQEDWPLDLRLDVRAAFRAPFVDADIEEIVALLADPDAGDQLAAMTDHLVTSAREDVARMLHRRGQPRGPVDAFFAEVDAAARAHEVTEDLADETFKITVRMPGEVVAHDGTTVEGSAVTWEFAGEALMDRTQKLRATSRLRR